MAVEVGGGYDADFVEPLPSHLECPVCLLALRNPNILSCCGIKVCFSCIDQVKSSKRSCPMCREEGFQTMLEKQLSRLILDLKVYCRYREKGCDWRGELRDLDQHLEGTLEEGSCKYVQVLCQYDCGQLLFRCDIKSHELKDCLKRPVESQVYQLREILVEMRLQHQSDIKALEEEMKREIDDLKSKVSSLEKANSQLQTKLNDVIVSVPPAAFPSPVPTPPSPSAPVHSSSGIWLPTSPPPPPSQSWHSSRSYSMGGYYPPHPPTPSI